MKHHFGGNRATMKSLEEYLSTLPLNRKEVINKIVEIMENYLPNGFEKTISYGMIGFVVPLSKYPQGYLDNKQTPLPFIHIASQKNFIAIYHMGLYADKELLEWFQYEYKTQVKTKLDMGKSCIRFHHMDDIPYHLLKELFTKMTVDQFIMIYEKGHKK